MKQYDINGHVPVLHVPEKNKWTINMTMLAEPKTELYKVWLCINLEEN